METEATDTSWEWTDFAKAIVSAGRHKWEEIAYELKFPHSRVESLKHERSSFYLNLRKILEEFKEKEGEGRNMRKEILKACEAVGIRGALEEHLEDQLRLKKKEK